MARDHETSISKKTMMDPPFKGFQSAALKRLITTCTLQKQKLTISSDTGSPEEQISLVASLQSETKLKNNGKIKIENY